MKKMLIRLMLVVLITVFLTSAGHCELFIWEPFDYPVGLLDGCRPDPKKPNDPDTNPGFGLETWNDYSFNEPAEVQSGSLIHPSYDIETLGNHAVIVDGTIGAVFQTYLFDDGQDYWLSFLYQAVNLVDEGRINGFFVDDNDNPEIDITIADEFISLYSRYLDESEDADVTESGTVKWMLIKFETSGNTDSEMVYWWVDPMPGIEPDVADADITIECSIPSGFSWYFLWWEGWTASTTPMFRFDEIRLGTEFSDVSAAPPCNLANTPTPEDNETNVDKTDTTLSWLPPTCLEGELTYDVYLGIIPDPNVGDNPRVVTNEDVTSYAVPPENLEYDTTYHWRVDIREPNDTGYILHQGLPWSFTTGPPSPVIKTQPEDVTVAAGGEATFTVVVLNEPTYQWYYSETPEGEGSEISGATDSTYTIEVVLKDDHEGYYYCIATNAYGEDESVHARLLTERLMAHWMFEGNLEDQIDAANDGISLEPVSYDAGAGGGQAVVIVDPNQFVLIENEIGRLKSITVTGWLKPTLLEEMQVILTATESTDSGVVYLHGADDELWGQVYGSASLGGGELKLNEWNLCALKYDAEAEEASLYLNGNLIDSGEINASVAPILPPLSIGALNSVENFYYVNGLVDDVRIYNYPVSHLEIARMYTDTIPDSTACLGNPQYDLNEDCLVNILDFAILAANWANCNIVPECRFALPGEEEGS